MEIIEARRIDQVRVAEVLAAGIERADERGRAILVSHTERVAWTDSVAFFERGRALTETAFFWEQAARDFAIIGVGAAHTIESHGAERFAQTAAAWRDFFGRCCD